MRWGLVAITAFVSAPQVDAAPKVAFPYEATVEAAETYVRSGPGSKYYPTAKLQQGQRVMVHRHDPGWHMIAPPAGSFSWVRASAVDKVADDRGTVNDNNVDVHVGSFESDIRDVLTRRLAKGDEVEILGEKRLPPVKGSGPEELWYRIAPPRGEWRWVAAQDLSPAPRKSDLSAADDPFDVQPARSSRTLSAPVTSEDDAFERPLPREGGRSYLDEESPSKRGHRQGDDSGIIDRPLVRRRGKPSATPRAEPASDKQLASQLEELDRLDVRFRSILDKEPLEWDFTQLEQDYRALRAEVEGAELQQMIDTRLARIVGYERTRAEQAELARISQETLRRDAELAQIQRQHEARLTALQQQSRFDGAGIVERSALARKGAPGHVLMAPSGKVLAYLVAGRGVNLDSWIGRPAGVNGRRVPRPDLKADLITVTRLTPVRLAP